MTSSSVYLEAAKIVDKGIERMSCWAIDLATGREPGMTEPSHERKAYAHLFQPNRPQMLAWGEEWSESFEERKACRLIALTLMAAIVDYEAKHGR